MYCDSALTFLNAKAEHLSRTPLVSKQLFSLKSLAAMHPLKAFMLSSQNCIMIACLGDPSSSLGKLNKGESFSQLQYDRHLQNNSLIDEGRLFLSSTKHVDHILSWHVVLKT